MMRILYSLMTIGLILTLAFTGCSKRSESGSGVWNSENSTFSIENEKLSYTLPTDASYWAIADIKTLPPNMLFFAIDSSEGIGVGLFRPDLELAQTKKAVDFTDQEVNAILKQLSSPHQDQTVIYEKIDKSKCILRDKESWSFIIEHKILDKAISQDSVPVFYSGYIFDGVKNPYGIVIISNVDSADSICQIQMKKYTSALNF